jgi:hypothetical protein
VRRGGIFSSLRLYLYRRENQRGGWEGRGSGNDDVNVPSFVFPGHMRNEMLACGRACMAGFNGLAQLGWAALGWGVCCRAHSGKMRDARCETGDVGHEARRGEAGCRGASVKARDGFVPLAGAGGWVAGLGRRLDG